MTVANDICFLYTYQHMQSTTIKQRSDENVGVPSTDQTDVDNCQRVRCVITMLRNANESLLTNIKLFLTLVRPC